jgi:hypothetical protein
MILTFAEVIETQILNKLLRFYLLYFTTAYSNTMSEQTVQLLLYFKHRLQQHSSRTNCSVSAYCILSYVTTTKFLNKLFSFHYILAYDTATQLLNKLFSFYYILSTGYSNTVPERTVQFLLTVYCHMLQQQSS